MPCSSSHMEATGAEIELSSVLTFLDELETGKTPNKNNLRGYHPGAYGKHISQKVLDEKTAELCEKLSGGVIDITTNSLELQLWWRDHQAFDAKREAKDADVQSLKDRVTQTLKQHGVNSTFLMGTIEGLVEDILEDLSNCD